MKIYISIPITGHDYNTQMAKAKVWEDTIRGLGHTPVNPFSTPSHPSWMDDEQEQYAYYMGEDIKALLLCDAIYMEMGWTKSKGCQLERQVAKIYGKKIFYSIMDIPNPINKPHNTMETTKGFNGKALYQPKGKAKEYSEWAVNFYTGCSNDCDYCYCKLGVLSHTWSNKPKLKKCFISESHALRVFNHELEYNINQIGKSSILFSFTTDPLLPETRDLTFQAMENAIDMGVPVKVLTKRADWINEFLDRVGIQSILYGRCRHLIAFGFTLTGCDENESHASTNEERINAMRCLYLLGYKTFASIEPIVDPKKSLEMIKQTQGFCGLYKVGTISGVRAGYNPRDMRNLMDYLVEKSREGQKIYLKDSFINWMGLDRGDLPGRFVNADYNIFTGK